MVTRVEYAGFAAPDAVVTAKPVPVLTIDGPSGSGKGTISREVADALGWHLLDSGALYRAVGYAASMAGLDLSDDDAVTRCAQDTRIVFRAAKDSGDTRVIQPTRSAPKPAVPQRRPLQQSRASAPRWSTSN